MPQQKQGPWNEKYAPPQEDGPWNSAYAPDGSTPALKSSHTSAPIDVDHDKAGMALVNSHMLNMPASSAYQNHDLISDQLKKRGVDSSTPASIANDIKAGLEGSIFGLSYRQKMPDTIKDPNMFDKFVTGLSGMVADLPFYVMGSLAGGALGGAAGSEVPGVGNVVGAGAGGSVGTFVVPAAIRDSLVQGIQKGDIKSFRDLMDRTVSAAWTGLKEAPAGLAAEISGGATIPLKAALGPAAPMAETALKLAQQGAAIETVSKLTNGQMPTADGFAVNTALMVAMHVTAAGFDKAKELTPKVQSRVMEEYKNSGSNPEALAAEVLRRQQTEPTEDVVGRINEITRKEAEPEAEKREPAKQEAVKEEGKEEGKEAESTQPPPASLRPAIKDEEGAVTIGGEGEVHPDIVERSQDGERGFVDRKGDFYTRDEAKAKLREDDPEVYKLWEQVAGGPDEEFHTTDYNEALRRSTGIKNASVDAQREQMGLPPIESPTRSLDADNWENAKQDVDSGRIEPLAIAESINRNPRGMSPEETNAINYYRARLSNDHKAAMDAIEKARQDDDPEGEQRAREQLGKVEDRINTVDEATKKAGTEWGLAGRMRQRTIAEDYSLDRVLQRARVASKNGVVSPEVRDKLETLTRQLEVANKKLEEYQSKQSEREADRSVERIKQEVERSGRKAARKAERIELGQEFDELVKEFDSLIMGRMSANPFFDPEVLGIIGKMAKNRVEAGLSKIEDIVDDIHAKLTDLGHDISKRDIRDAISGYGRTVEMSKDQIAVALREAKRQGKLISALEDAQAAVLPLKSGLQRDKATERVRELTKQVKQAMRDSGIDTRSSLTPEQQWKSALDSLKTRLRNQITELIKQLKTGEEPPERKGIVLDAEARVLKDQVDNLRIKQQQESMALRLKLREQLQGLEGKPGVSPERKIKMAMKAVENSIEELDRKIKENDLTPQQRKSGTPMTPELAGLRMWRDNQRETLRQMREAAKPKKSPQEIALDRYKKSLHNRIDDMERQLKTGDFNKEPQKKIVPDAEANELKIKAEKTRRQVDEAIAKQKREARSKTEKVVDTVTKWRRAALLTGWTTLGKLTKAAMDRMGVTPIEELVGGVLSHIPGIDRLAAKSPMHGGGLNISAEVKAVSQLWDKATAKDMWSELTHGHDSLDLLFGGKFPLPAEVIGFFGQLHGALKVPEKRAEFFRRFEIGMEFARRNNLDVNDPRVQSAVGLRSYLESQRAILMQDNAITGAWQVMLSYLHNKGALGRTFETSARFVFPMVRVATNLPGEALSYTPPALGVRAVEVFRMLADKDRMGKSAFDDLSMHDMDNIMRGLKKGSVGLALAAIGFAFRKNITGYYLTEQDKKQGIKRGVTKIGKVTVPALMNDTPPMIAIQLAATVGHVWDHYNLKGMSGGFVAGALQAGQELGKRVPFYGQVARTADETRTPEQSMVNLGEFAGSLLVPEAVREIAEARDKGADRKPTTFSQAIEMSIPGLRSNVPLRHSIRRGGRKGQ